MLSKVAERVYWTARYIERVENTARLVQVYANLLLDLPREVNLGWYNLITLNKFYWVMIATQALQSVPCACSAKMYAPREMWSPRKHGS